MRVVTIIGARPQFVKAAIVSRAFRNRRDLGHDDQEILVHTGQHYDANMSDVFFDEMDIPRPDHHLGIGGGSHGEMTGKMLAAIENVLLETQPDWVLVYGDTNSTAAGALAAVKLHIPVAHVEAGLRSFNRKMPEEINRIVADHVSDLLFAPTDVAVRNLTAEGIAGDQVVRSGDVMRDAAGFYRELATQRSDIINILNLEPTGFTLATVHRAENTDDPTRLEGIVEGLTNLAKDHPVVLPLHPRTRAALERENMLERVERALTITEPLGYLDMVRLEAEAGLIATDSGGVQKEAYFHGVPCITLRDETEWVELIDAGANTLVGTDATLISETGNALFGNRFQPGDLYGDGDAGNHIVEALAHALATPAHA